MSSLATFQTACGLSGVGSLTPEKVQEVEAKLLQLDQEAGSVIHRFGPGVYLRELSVSANNLIIGHEHRYPHMNIMLKGKLTLLKPDGTMVECVAPMIIPGSPGRKIAFVQDDMIWVNVFATDETDVATLEQQLFVKSDGWLENEHNRISLESLKHESDRNDYMKALEFLEMSHSEVLRISENEDDLIPMPEGDVKFVVAKSPISGRGIFATCDIKPGESVGPARIGAFRTTIGRFTNHSENPNCELVVMDEDDCVLLVATQELQGCRGGKPGDEATVDYRRASPKYESEALCHRRL